MTNRRNQGDASFDLVMPIPINHRTDFPLRDDSETTIWAMLDSRTTTLANTTMVSESTEVNHTTAKMSSSARPKVEILRANSPTLKRLFAVRMKLDRYASTLPRVISPSRPTEELVEKPIHVIHEEKPPPIHHERPVRSVKPKSSKKVNTQKQGPVEKITYEKTLTRNGSVKQKCSLEIWLPQADADEEEENANFSRIVSAKTNVQTNKSHSPPAVTHQSRQSSIIKVSPTIVKPVEKQSFEELPTKNIEHVLIPRVFHYEKNPNDPPEERPRSGKSGDTTKSDGDGPSKMMRRRRIHRQTRYTSGVSNNSEDSVQTVVPMSSKNLFENLKQNISGQELRGSSDNNQASSMINELMKKYTIMKKSHQELTQTKLQLEKPHQDLKGSAHVPKDTTISSPPTSEPTVNNSPEHPSMSVKKINIDASPPRSAVDQNHTSNKLLDRRSSHRKVNHSDLLPQARLVALANHLQHRQASASMAPPPPHLPTVMTRKNDDSFTSLQRSKTMDVDSDPLNSNSQNPTRSSAHGIIATESREIVPILAHRLQSTIKGNEQLSPSAVRRTIPPPLLSLRAEQQRQAAEPILHLVQYHNVQPSTQRYHHPTHSSANTSTTSATATSGSHNNKVLVHLKYSNGANTDRNCLVPE